MNRVTEAEFSCPDAVSSEAAEVNVPNHTPSGTTMFRNSTTVDGPVEVLIVTYSKDFPWLVYCLRAIRKYLTGFQGVTVAHPSHESRQFETLLHQFDVRLHPYSEVAGKGFIHHEIKMAEADLFLPASTKYVFYMDADCIFKMPTAPEDYFINGRPYYLIRSWESLTTEDPHRPGSKVISDCLQWRIPTAHQLGFDPIWYTMCMNTGAFPLSWCAPYREHISKVHGKPFHRFMFAGRNKWPQDRMDWTAMGAWCHRFMRDAFTWINVVTEPYPADRKQAFWSHGGITPSVRETLEQLVN